MSSITTASQAGHPPDVTIILVSYNTCHLLERLFSALSAGRGALSLQIIVVDNASRDGSVDVIRCRYPEVELLTNDINVGFGRANNQALPLAKGRYLLLLNTDAFVSADTLTKTLKYMDEHAVCGVLGVKLIGDDGNVQPSCRFFPTPWNVFLLSTGLTRFFPATRLVDDPTWDPASERECDWVPGCYYLVRREVVERVGLFDPRFLLYYEEVDHCRAVKAAGWKVVYYPHTQVVHTGGESAGSVGALVKSTRQISSLQIESELLYFRKHFGLSGVISATFLTFVAESIRAARAVLRGLGREKAIPPLRHLAEILRALSTTHFGTRPTR